MTGMNRLWLALRAGLGSALGVALLAVLATALPRSRSSTARGGTEAAGDRRAGAARPSTAAAAAPERTGTRAAQLYDRPAGAASRWTCPTRAWPCRIAASTSKSGGVDTILAAEAGGRTRLVLNLDSLMPYQTRVDGNSIVVTIGGSQQAAAEQPARLWQRCGGEPWRRGQWPAQHPQHRFPAGARWRRTRDRGTERPAHAGEPAPAGHADRGRLRGRIAPVAS